MHIFTYGTLMFPEVWQAVVGRACETVAGMAIGFAVYRVAGAGFPGIVEAGGGDTVRGVVHLDVDTASVICLDRFEDDFYVRQTLSIACEDGQQRAAEAYVVPAQKRAVLTDEPWTRDAFVTGGGLDDFIRRFAGLVRVQGDR